MTALCLALGCGFRGGRGDWDDVLEPVEPAPLLSDGSTRYLYDELMVYRVGGGDALSVTVLEHSEFDGPAGVDERGRMAVPGTDKVVEVTDLTLDEVTGRIAEILAPYVIGKPQVRVSLTSSASKYYYVLGGIGRPGVYSMGARTLTLREALAAAGFFMEHRADKRRVGIITPDAEKPTYLIADGAAILMGEDKYNIIMKPGDIIFVQDRVIYDIDRFLYEMFIMTENVSTTDKAVKFWEKAVDGEFGDFAAPRRGLTIIY
jgi:protein involved in polysaccharide export with SLBB domain